MVAAWLPVLPTLLQLYMEQLAKQAISCNCFASACMDLNAWTAVLCLCCPRCCS